MMKYVGYACPSYMMVALNLTVFVDGFSFLPRTSPIAIPFNINLLRAELLRIFLAR
jgi:hypothetical protein